MIYDLIQLGGRPRYRAVVQAVIDGIAQNRLQQGQRLPTQRELAQELDMAVATVGRAYMELESQGFVTSHVGRGTFVAAPRAGLGEVPAVAREQIEMSIYRVPVPALKVAFEAVMQSMLNDGVERIALGSAPVAGLPEHRRALSEWVSRFGIESHQDRLIVTNGGQHAVMCAVSTLTHAGDLIATEALTDPRMKAIVGYLDRRLVGIEMDADGLIPESLDAICREQRVAAVYCTPRCQNPTNAMLSLARKQALVEVARRHNIPIIESDIYGTLMGAETDSPPIAALAPERTHFVTSLGRIFGPGVKIGCIVSPLVDVSRVQAGLSMSTGFATSLMAEMAVRWFRNGTLDAMTEWQRQEVQRRLAIVGRFPLLSKARTHPLSPHVWLQLPEPWRAEEFVDTALSHQVAIAPTHSFVVGRCLLPHAVRLCIGSPATLGSLEAACERLERILLTSPRVNREAV